MGTGDSDSEALQLKQLALQKETEWRQAQEKRIVTLETLVEKKTDELSTVKSKFDQLKEDFKYNYKLLKERDKELETSDRSLATLKQEVIRLEEALSDAKVQTDSARQRLRSDQNTAADVQKAYSKQINSLTLELQRAKNERAAVVEKLEDELSVCRHALNEERSRLQSALDAQRTELMAGFDDAQRKLQSDMRSKLDEQNTDKHSAEIRADMLTRELELSREAGDRVQKQLNETTEQTQQLHKQIRQNEWDLADLTATFNSEKDQMLLQIQQLKDENERVLDEKDNNRLVMERRLREAAETLQRHQSASDEKSRQLSSNIATLQGEIEGLKDQVKIMKRSSNEVEESKDTEISRLQTALDEATERVERQRTEEARRHVDRQEQQSHLETLVTELKQQLHKRADDIQRYRNDATRNLDQIAQLEREKEQLRLECTRKCEKIERDQLSRAEDLIKSLTEDKTHAQAEAKSSRTELSRVHRLLEEVTSEREAAVQTLRSNGLHTQLPITPVHLETKETAELEEQVEKLTRQNQALKATIRQMKEAADDNSTQFTSEYVRQLEAQVEELESRRNERDSSRERRDVIDQQRRDVLAEQELKKLPVVRDNPGVAAHIDNLNSQIASLRAERAELRGQVLRQQARLEHLQRRLEDAEKQPERLKVELEQARYEQEQEKKQNSAKVNLSQRQIEDLERRLSENQQEAAALHQNNLEQNSELEAANRQVSQLRLQLADKTPAINFGAQELLIEQLRGEVKRLQSRLTSTSGDEQKPGASQTCQANHEQLLRAAARRIEQLLRERKQYVSLNNRLRAQLYSEQGAGSVARVALPPRPETSRPAVTESKPAWKERSELKPAMEEGTEAEWLPTEVKSRVRGQLEQLERLGYDLTKQELQQQIRSTSPRRVVDLSPVRGDLPATRQHESSWPTDDSLTDEIRDLPRRGRELDLLRASYQSHASTDVVSLTGSKVKDKVERLVQQCEELDNEMVLPEHPYDSELVGRQVSQSDKSSSTSFAVKGRPIVTSSRPKTVKTNIKAPLPHKSRAAPRNWNVRSDNQWREKQKS